MKVYHKLSLKNGAMVVMARSNFHPSMGHQVVGKTERWDAVKMTVSHDGEAVSEIVERKLINKKLKPFVKAALKKLRVL